MVLFKVIETGLAEEARKISETIASLPDDRWKDVKFENDNAQKRMALSHIPGDVTLEFRTRLNKIIVEDFQRLARDHATAKIRKARPKEYELPPTVLRAQSASHEPPNWLEISQHEITIFQPFHTLNSDAKLHLRSKLTGKKHEVELQHSAVILVLGGVMYLPEPLDIPILTQRLLTEPTDN